MHIGFYSHTKQFNNNKMFLDPGSPIGDNLMYPFVLLAQRLKELGHKASTIDTDNINDFDAIVFIEFPGIENRYFKYLTENDFKNLYLITFESPIIKPDNYNTKNHKYFKKIFTWEDNLVDNKKYFKINYSHKIPEKPDLNAQKKEKLCAIIASNKFAHNANELYSERRNAIRWFENSHPENFDLYGVGWDRYNFYGEFFGIKLARLNRIRFLTKLLAPHYPSYKGGVKSKNETYKDYKFSICYENAKDFNGYITEKIFDCFMAGCVPVYLGASNITQHIPADCFIDKRKFKTYEELYKYIKNMPDEEYIKYLNAIENFLKSGKSYPFSAEYFSNTLIKEITS